MNLSQTFLLCKVIKELICFIIVKNTVSFSAHIISYIMTCLFLTTSAYLLQLSAVHLVDSHYCADPAKFISVLCTSLSTMLHVELPHVNILSKMDLIEQYGKLGLHGDDTPRHSNWLVCLIQF